MYVTTFALVCLSHQIENSNEMAQTIPFTVGFYGVLSSCRIAAATWVRENSGTDIVMRPKENRHKLFFTESPTPCSLGAEADLTEFLILTTLSALIRLTSFEQRNLHMCAHGTRFYSARAGKAGKEGVGWREGKS